MLFMMIVKASKNSESKNLPNKALMKKMDDYNDALIEAGVRVMAKGLHPTSSAVRLIYSNQAEKPIVEYGPFTPVNEQVAGFFIIECTSMEKALEWALKAPDPQGNGEGQIELRQIY